jgi:protein involved in polysaccharide export with SLBB domain
MSNPTWNRSTPLSVRLLCVFMAGLTACTTTRSQYTWHDVSRPAGIPKATQMQDSWGADAEGSNVSDPQIAPGFLLTMRSVTDSKLNGDYRVDFDGGLQLPYDITVNTTGMTLSQMKKKLADLFHPYFKTTPDIDLHVKERRYWIDVRGLVEKPGRDLVEPGASLDQLIGMAGGTSKESPPQYVRIQKGQKLFVFDLNHYYSPGDDHPKVLGWYGGEIVFFQKDMAGSSGERSSTSPYRLPVYMLGEVRKPGEYTLNAGSDFLDTLVLAGGFTDRADLDNIEIIRRTSGRKQTYDFSWSEIQNAPTPLQGDVIFVHADSTTKSERRTVIWATIISALASIVTSTVLVLAYNRGHI